MHQSASPAVYSKTKGSRVKRQSLPLAKTHRTYRIRCRGVAANGFEVTHPMNAKISLRVDNITKSVCVFFKNGKGTCIGPFRFEELPALEVAARVVRMELTRLFEGVAGERP